MNEKDSQLRMQLLKKLKPAMISEEQFEMGFQRRIVLEQVTNSKVTTGEDRGSLIW